MLASLNLHLALLLSVFNTNHLRYNRLRNRRCKRTELPKQLRSVLFMLHKPLPCTFLPSVQRVPAIWIEQVCP